MANGKLTVSLYIIGTELTRGIISDKHGQLLSKELTTLGYEINRMIMVPDDGSIAPLLQQCIKDTDIVILTGGLGPTSDDMTRQVVADIAQVPLVEDPEAYAMLYERIGERIHGANRRQVMIPQDFHPIPNPKGTACGFWGEFDSHGKTVRCFALPGPPFEMHHMLYNYVLPQLSAFIGHQGEGRSEFSCFLTPESKLEEMCKEHARDGIVWGTRVQEHRISLYLNGAQNSSRSAMGEAISDSLGRGLLWEKDIEAVDLVVDILKENNLSISCAESCTGGYVGKLLTEQSGSSSYFWGSLVTYANEAKTKILSVKEETLHTYGAVSEQTAIEMARGALKLSGTDVAISITGIAGPDGGSDEKPVGTLCFGFASKSAPSTAVTLSFTTYGRSSVRRRGAVAALILSYFYVKGEQLLDIIQTWQYI
ncbi:MAG: nicotinamide-nucleotide amidohydrolase family protein [Sphaerochaetaceae bacterium]